MKILLQEFAFSIILIRITFIVACQILDTATDKAFYLGQPYRKFYYFMLPRKFDTAKLN
jgi:hypothetical protein